MPARCRRALLSLLLAGSVPLAAHTQSCDPSGTWAGTLGSRPIMLDLNWDGLGSYYLGTAFTQAVLRPQEGGAQEWQEFDESGRRTGSLHLACDAAGMKGGRVAGDGRRTALRLQRTDGGDYNQRRLATAELVPVRTLAEQGHALEIVAVRGFPTLTTLRIRQPRGAEAAINERLRADLLQQLDNHLACRALARAQGRFDGPEGDTVSVQHVAWRGSILWLELWMHGYCGGANGYRSARQFTFDTRSGQELPLAGWLAPEWREGIPANTPLHRQLVLPQILRGRKELAELPPAWRDCAEYELDEPAVPLGIEDGGLVFGFHYSLAMNACGLSFVLSWAQLQPALSADGERWRQAMLSSPAH